MFFLNIASAWLVWFRQLSSTSSRTPFSSTSRAKDEDIHAMDPTLTHYLGVVFFSQGFWLNLHVLWQS